jgi:L,D-transpeptidase YcbB
MRVHAGLVIGFAGVLCLFGLPPSRGALADSSDAHEAALAARVVPAMAEGVANLSPISPAFVTQSPTGPAYVEPLLAQAAAVDREPVGTLPEKDAPAIKPQESKVHESKVQESKIQDSKPQDSNLQEARQLPEPDGARESLSDSVAAKPPAPLALVPATETQTEVPAPREERAAEKPPGLADFIKSALEASSPKDVKGAKAAELGKEHAAIAAFYAAHDYAAVWIADGKANAAARAALAQLAHAEDDGLDLRAFAVPVFEGNDEKLAAAEIALSAEVVAYGRQASGSRVDPRQISALIGAKPDVADPAAILTQVAAAADDAGQVLKGFNPPQKGYEALRQKLAELRHVAVPTARVTIPAGPDLKVGMRDPRVSLIRARFGLDGPPPATSEDLVYDTRVAAAVADFQKANGLPASGVLSARTIAALSGGQPVRLENEILANMERWRWMPRELGASRIEVNIPDFMVTVIRDGEVVARNKVVVGKTTTPTPVFSNTMQFLIVNPYWNVPQSIIRKEMLPKLGQDPSYLQRLGYQVTSKHGVLTVRQPPGERNALGRIKFMFPNDYSVYLHDTPSRALFGSEQRAFSHGCVRVDQPFSFAEAVLGRDHGWSVERVKHLIGGSERYVYLPKPLPIHIEYFTAYVDDAGHLQLRDDIYGYSNRVKTALGLAN